MQDIETEQAPASSAGAEQILIVESYLSREVCDQFCKHIEAKFQAETAVEYKHMRTAYMAPLGDLYPMLRKICYDVLTKKVEPFFRAEIEWWEQPQLLRYDKGGKYESHVDNSEFAKDKNPPWIQRHDRNLSFLIYLNDDFTGGTLTFPKHNVTITPKPGLLVAFPSDHDFEHGVAPTETGLRYVLVTWAAAKGYPRVREKPPWYFIPMEEWRGKL